jgi:putative membrane protein
MLGSTQIASLIIRWLMLALSVWIAAELIPGIHLEGLVDTLAVAAVLGLLNLYVKPVLVFLSCPLTVVTLGLFLIIVNAFVLWLADVLGSVIGIDFQLDDVWSAILGAIIISLVGLVLGMLVDPDQLARGITRGRRRLY